MRKEKLTLQQQLAKLIVELNKSFALHEYLIEYGGQDPFWPDGVNINLVRNHIIADKSKIINFCTENNLPYPDELYNPTPELVDDDYMANLSQEKRVERLKKQGNKLTTTKPKPKNEQRSFL